MLYKAAANSRTFSVIPIAIRSIENLSLRAFALSEVEGLSKEESRSENLVSSSADAGGVSRTNFLTF